MSKKIEVYDLIVDRLVRAQYRFGDRILVKDLVVETGASRQPIMSALGRLEADGFVQIAPQVGCEVIDPGQQAISDFYRMFGELEALLAGFAAERRTDSQLERLRADQYEISLLSSDDPNVAFKYARANRQFHQTLHAMAGSELISDRQSLNFDMSDFLIAQAVGFDRLVDRVLEDHDDIIGAVADKDPEIAAQLARRHIENVAHQIESAS